MLDNAFLIRYHKPRKRTWDALKHITGGICSMRLHKKAAVCLLTAAMAISMLTACGGGGTGGNGGSTGGNTLPDDSNQIILPDPGEGEGGGEGGGEGTETKPTKTPIIDVNNSKLAKFNEKYAGATEFYVEAQMIEYDEDGSTENSTDGCVAAKSDNVYMKITLSGKNQKQLSIEELMLKEGDYNNNYLLLRNGKVAVRMSSYKSESDDPISLGTLITEKLPRQMWSTKVKVGPTEYYAEVYNNDNTEHTICFAPDGKPVYEFVRELNEKRLDNATLYKTIQAGSGSSKRLCRIPTGFKTYSFDFRNGTLTDANGNVFTLVPQTNGAGDVTSVKVFDKNNKDVSNNFKWVYDFYTMYE